MPLRKPNPDPPVDTYRWFIELFLIGSANNLFRPYHDSSLEGLIDSMSTGDAMEKFLMFIKEFNFYAVLEMIIDLDTTVTASFAAKALLVSITLEDEKLQKMLLVKKISVDEVQTDSLFEHAYGPVSAIHLAVEQQNESLIRRLLEAGIDPDGYTTSEREYGYLKPLSRLLFLLCLRTDSRVVQISTTIVKTLLDAQRCVYDNHHCESYLVSFFIRSWLADVPECLDFLQRYCKGLTAGATVAHDWNPLRTIADNDDVDLALQEILQHAPAVPDWDINYGYEEILLKIIQKQSLELLRILYSEPAQSIFRSFHRDSRLKCSMTLEAATWLLQQDIRPS